MNNCIWTPNYFSKPLRTGLLGQRGRLLEKLKVLHAKPLAYPVARPRWVSVCVTERNDLIPTPRLYRQGLEPSTTPESRQPPGARPGSGVGRARAPPAGPHGAARPGGPAHSWEQLRVLEPGWELREIAMALALQAKRARGVC